MPLKPPATLRCWRNRCAAWVRELSSTAAFTDNAVRVDGRLRNTGEATEVCQHYAFYFGTAERLTRAVAAAIEQCIVRAHHAFRRLRSPLLSVTTCGLIAAARRIEQADDWRDARYYYMAERTGTSKMTARDHGSLYAAFMLLNCSRKVTAAHRGSSRWMVPGRLGKGDSTPPSGRPFAGLRQSAPRPPEA